MESTSRMPGLTLLCLAAAITSCNNAMIGNDVLKNVNENVTSTDVEGTNFTLYTKTNPDTPITITAENLKSVSNFFASRETKIVVLGWPNTTERLDDIRQGYLQSNGDYNIVMVDWSVDTARNYTVARSMVMAVGETLASLIEAMVQLGTNTSRITIVGHSLGAHIAGIASDKAGRVGRVVGLDPSSPGFASVATSGRLDKSDADFVEVIHTDAGALGWDNALGHSDFYPNGGMPLQPGCFGSTVGCSHGRAIQFFAESITTRAGFWGVECRDWVNFRVKQCNNHTKVLMGENTPASVPGNFYLKTRSSSPFAMGRSGARTFC